jgi:hypothetical protein
MITVRRVIDFGLVSGTGAVGFSAPNSSTMRSLFIGERLILFQVVARDPRPLPKTVVSIRVNAAKYNQSLPEGPDLARLARDRRSTKTSWSVVGTSVSSDPCVLLLGRSGHSCCE